MNSASIQGKISVFNEDVTNDIPIDMVRGFVSELSHTIESHRVVSPDNYDLQLIYRDINNLITDFKRKVRM